MRKRISRGASRRKIASRGHTLPCVCQWNCSPAELQEREDTAVMNGAAEKGLQTQAMQGTQSRRGTFLKLALSLREGKGSR